MKLRKYVFLLIIIFSLFYLSCEQKNTPRTFFSLGTVCAVNLFEDGTNEKYDIIVEYVNDVEKKMTINNETNGKNEISEVELINAKSGESRVVVSDETFYVIKSAYEMAKKTDGAFEPTIGPLSKLWNVTSELPKVPSQDEIAKMLPHVNWQNLQLDVDEKSVFLKKEKMMLDLGGIAKGFATDKTVALLKKWGVKKALIDYGGNIYAYGSKDKENPLWKIGIKNPLEPDGGAVLRIDLKDKAVITSGIYERFFEEEGEKFHHIIDGKTGYCAKTDVASVTIVSDNATEADAYSTACLVMGLEKGIHFLESKTSVEGIFITEQRKIFTTKGLKEKLILLNKSFEIIQ
ncbi:MAG: FAD:protein FMN transferase [Treponema sp.]|nr:FAD:protein FMN transferase [Treponema sp.]